jgi:insulysin
MDIIKPDNDNRNYKYYVLDNNIKCILINDDMLDKTCVVTSVNVGSIANKEYYDGMAHLLEHMCFITSKKYKTKNYLSHQITEAGGHVNAFTSDLNTVYYFDVFTKHIESILEIFIDFLINAELKEEYILEELKNVDAEHKKNINSDMWRLFSLSKILIDETNPSNGFYTGSSKTLQQTDIHKRMIDFYNRYYNANNISICIASNKSITELYSLANKYFGSIPKTNINNNLKMIKPLYTKNRGNTYHMEALGDDKILEILFETDVLPKTSVDLFYICASIISSPERNLCIDYLKSNGYITNLSASYDINGLFNISVQLTQNGLSNIVFVLDFIEYTVNKILLFDWINIFNYYKQKNIFLFNNLNKIDSIDLCTDFLTALLYYSPEQIYCAKYIFTNITASDINNLKKYIKFKDCIKVIVSKKFNYKQFQTDFNYKQFQTDPNYNTKYTNIHFLPNKLTTYKQPITYDLINPFLKIKPTYILNIDHKIPTQIQKNIWYGGTSEFNEPVIYCNIMFSNKKYFETSKNSLLTYLSVSILNYYFQRELYKASEFNFIASFVCCPQYNAIELGLYMYNDLKYVQIFIDRVFDLLLNNIVITDELINTKIDNMIDSLNNIITSNPWSYCDYIFDNSYNSCYMYTELLKIIKTITIKEIKIFMKQIIEKSGITIFIYGNIKLNNLPTFNKIQSNMKESHACYPSLHIKKTKIYTHPNQTEKSNCVKISYFTGKYEPLNNLHLLFIKLITYDLFYADLRSTKQLGYLVVMYTSSINNEYYIYQKVQSELSCDEITKHINNFNDTLIDCIKKIDLNKWKENISNHLNKKETNINELFENYYLEIAQRTFLFNRKQLLLKYLDNITIDSLCLFITNNILNNKRKSIIKIKKQ